MPDDDLDLAAFARAFQRLQERVDDLAPERPSVLRTRVTTHLGIDPAQLPSHVARFDATERVNVQLAIDAIVASSPGSDLVGVPAELRSYGSFSLASLLSGHMGSHVVPTAPAYVDLPVAIDETLPCLELGIHLLHVDGVAVVALLGIGEQHGPAPEVHLEVLSPESATAETFLRRVRALMDELNVYRGKALSFSYSEYGSFGITFHRVPVLTRSDLILPEEDLLAIEQHTVVVAEHAAELQAAGRHLKRGLLLFGPPGTGKTLSVMYLCNALPGRTTLLLSGVASGALGQAAAIARRLQPSMIVLEDVDLVAMERMMPGMGTNPLLFQLLNEMDGLAEDADVIFVLTTNRVDLLEPALAARPGRIDQAVEIKLPDADGRRRLFELYLRGVELATDRGDGLEALVTRTEGVSAAFIKELVRRAVLASYMDGGGPVTPERLDAAVTDLLERSTPVLRSSLGANPDAPTMDAHGDW